PVWRTRRKSRRGTDRQAAWAPLPDAAPGDLQREVLSGLAAPVPRQRVAPVAPPRRAARAPGGRLRPSGKVVALRRRFTVAAAAAAADTRRTAGNRGCPLDVVRRSPACCLAGGRGDRDGGRAGGRVQLRAGLLPTQGICGGGADPPGRHRAPAER